MKKLPLVVLGMALCIPQFLWAQNTAGDQELSASYGRESGTDMIRGFSSARSRPSLDHASYNSATSNSGTMFLTYRYFFTNKLALGATLGTEFVSFDHNSNPLREPPVLLGKYKANVTTLALELKPVYYNGKLVRLYGLVGLGIRNYTEKQVSGPATPGQTLNDFPGVFFNSQWTPIGIQVGKTLSGFAELGLGYKGMINAGVSYTLKRKAAKPEAKQP